MNIIFLGTPDFALPALDAINKSEHKILCVVTQPDKPSDRGHKVKFSPVKEYAKSNGIDVLQYKKIRVEGVNDLKHLNPDIMVTCAYGQILSQEIIDIPKYGIINIHASLLPKYRGAAPITWALINGEQKTGVTIMRTDAGVDTGDILIKKEVDIDPDENSGQLFDKLSTVGAQLILEGLKQIENNTAVFVPQDNSKASHYPMLKKEIGQIDFTKTAYEVKNLIRALNPWPLAYFTYEDNVIKVFSSHIVKGMEKGKCGEVMAADSKNGLLISCSDELISIDELQYPNSKRMDVKAFLNGRTIEVGKVL